MTQTNGPSIVDSFPRLAAFLTVLFLAVTTFGFYKSNYDPNAMLLVLAASICLLFCEVRLGRHLAWRNSRIFVFSMVPLFYYFSHGGGAYFGLFVIGASLAAMHLGVWIRVRGDQIGGNQTRSDPT